MAKRKHAEMIKAWADNDELIVLVRLTGGWLACSGLAWHEDSEYFLCLPSRAEACQHWLNGGETEGRYLGGEWKTLFSHACCNWSVDSVFMHESYEVRIKPKTEKRWILALESSLASMIYFDSYESAVNANKSGNFQVIEIEVEVK